MNGKQKEFLAKSGINLTDGLVYFSENERLYEKYLFRFPVFNTRTARRGH